MHPVLTVMMERSRLARPSHLASTTLARTCSGVQSALEEADVFSSKRRSYVGSAAWTRKSRVAYLYMRTLFRAELIMNMFSQKRLPNTGV